jgi:hypothetical protein
VKIACLCEDPGLADRLLPMAGLAARRLGLDGHLARMTLCLDDIVADERVWMTFHGGTGAGQGPDRAVTIYLHPLQLLKDRPSPRGFLPGPASWENLEEAGRHASACDPGDYSPAKVERFLYHQFLSVRDLCDGSVQLNLVPVQLAEAFQEAWAVTVDGRLRRSRLPGYPVADRRRRFHRVFSVAGVLLPEHWAQFHALWETDAMDTPTLLRQVARLPRLPRSQQ